MLTRDGNLHLILRFSKQGCGLRLVWQPFIFFCGLVDNAAAFLSSSCVFLSSLVSAAFFFLFSFFDFLLFVLLLLRPPYLSAVAAAAYHRWTSLLWRRHRTAGGMQILLHRYFMHTRSATISYPERLHIKDAELAFGTNVQVQRGTNAQDDTKLTKTYVLRMLDFTTARSAGI